MGSGIANAQVFGTVDSLNGMFNGANIAATFAAVEGIRKAHPNFLNWQQGGVERHQTLRFAALLLTDALAFPGNGYPAGNFQKWLRWLTWLHQQPANAGNLKYGNPYNDKPHKLIMEVLADALAPGADPTTLKPVKFAWNAGGTFKVVATTGTNYTITVTSLDETGVPDYSADAEDNV